ncbi:protein kinase inhibitor beta, cAMP dependent, catalytic, isoform CRA_c [Rattus norvegicus]|uniref:Protein kinase inhibitor beta, cAMP dependent, catalytic, isoform CRA_c n=1 Tax=Rattus norvegicus TaxID=10116 RepID=A6K4D2_RAT|nr:protein kinase inhibitor beta, cAMP dependent, catalytic, isoform CRA_c [Rattus norvegicus]EDL92894.1 protein kinase inhibitor beta, cAMP dependent, catalytic, isoform CRA_c [Rattus norvegicus]EDL92895.1 protein kinase inhibitor beta, cAMP dependent, catalytic, isoform CRA_c [Rattus norvegicus]
MYWEVCVPGTRRHHEIRELCSKGVNDLLHPVPRVPRKATKNIWGTPDIPFACSKLA